VNEYINKETIRWFSKKKVVAENFLGPTNEIDEIIS
jgi:hypothetical protein